MDIENKILQIESLEQMSFEDVLSLYRQGYMIAEQNSNIGIELGLNVLNIRGNNVRSLVPTCPSTVKTGGTLTLSASVTSGTAPYTYHWTVTKPDGTTDTSLTGASNSYTFATDGQYTVSVNVTDKCPTGSKTSNTESCTITASVSGGDGGGCGTCPTDKNYCLVGQCIPKTYAYAGIGVIALLVLVS